MEGKAKTSFLKYQNNGIYNLDMVWLRICMHGSIRVLSQVWKKGMVNAYTVDGCIYIMLSPPARRNGRALTHML